MIAITGASGLVGANLMRELLARGQTIRALYHQDRRAMFGLDVDSVRADLADPASLEQAFAGADIVYHLASQITLRSDRWEETSGINVDGTRNVVDACLRCGVRRLVYFGSAHTRQQEPLDLPLDEDRPPVSGEDVPVYERSKALAELEVQKGAARGLDTVTILPTAIVGPYDFRPSYVGQGLQLIASGKLPALVSGGYDWVDVRDVVAGAIRAAQVAPAGGCYILSGHWHGVGEVAAMVSEITGRPAPRLLVPLWLADLVLPLMEKMATLSGAQPLYTHAMLHALRSNRQMSHARAARELDYAPRPFRETLEDTFVWFQQQGKSG